MVSLAAATFLLTLLSAMRGVALSCALLAGWLLAFWLQAASKRLAKTRCLGKKDFMILFWCSQNNKLAAQMLQAKFPKDLPLNGASPLMFHTAPMPVTDKNTPLVFSFLCGHTQNMRGNGCSV
jgi:hypothetical protein